jgi:hypothetical protein
MMPRVVVTHVMMMADTRRVRVAYNNVQPSVDGSEHEARGNESAEAQQSEDERGGPTGYATASRPIRFTCVHMLTMPYRL